MVRTLSKLTHPTQTGCSTSLHGTSQICDRARSKGVMSAEPRLFSLSGTNAKRPMPSKALISMRATALFE